MSKNKKLPTVWKSLSSYLANFRLHNVYRLDNNEKDRSIDLYFGYSTRTDEYDESFADMLDTMYWRIKWVFEDVIVPDFDVDAELPIVTISKYWDYDPDASTMKFKMRVWETKDLEKFKKLNLEVYDDFDY